MTPASGKAPGSQAGLFACLGRFTKAMTDLPLPWQENLQHGLYDAVGDQAIPG